MSNTFDFSSFSKQSPRGILIIYLQQLYNLVKLTWVLIFFIVKDFSRISSLSLFYIYSSVFCILLFYFIRAFLIYKNFQFKVENHHFILQQGILSKTNTSIPFHRIQNINFKQNLIQQLIDVYEVSIETAGSTDTEIAIKALSFDKANALKNLITVSNDNDTIQVVDKSPFITISPLALFKVSLTENHLRNLFLFFVLVIGFFQQIQQIFDGFGKTETIDGFIKNSTSILTASFFFVFLLLFILTVTAFITSFVRIFLVHFNLTAYIEKDAFEINQGLFTKKSLVLKKQKIQNIIISTNPLKRRIGISYVTFKQAVSGEISKKTEKVIKLVGCKDYQLKSIKNELFETAEIENLEKSYPDAYYKKRVYLFSLLVLTVVYSLMYLFLQPHLLTSLLIVIPTILFLIHKKLKKKFYKITEDMLLVGSGIIETHFAYLELFKVQNVKLHQTFFQERSKVADLVFQTASGKIKLPCLPLQLANSIYNYVLYKVETSTQPWM